MLTIRRRDTSRNVSLFPPHSEIQPPPSPADRRSRPQQWAGAIGAHLDLRDHADDLAAADLPKGFGR